MAPGLPSLRVEIMGPGKIRNVGKSQWVVIMINPIISTRTRITITSVHNVSCSIIGGIYLRWIV
eukprot:COSAG01_NODE_959_length_12451_cov_18.389815_9_plen_64_part_00